MRSKLLLKRSTVEGVVYELTESLVTHRAAAKAQMKAAKAQINNAYKEMVTLKFEIPKFNATKDMTMRIRIIADKLATDPKRNDSKHEVVEIFRRQLNIPPGVNTTESIKAQLTKQRTKMQPPSKKNGNKQSDPDTTDMVNVVYQRMVLMGWWTTKAAALPKNKEQRRIQQIERISSKLVVCVSENVFLLGPDLRDAAFWLALRQCSYFLEIMEVYALMDWCSIKSELPKIKSICECTLIEGVTSRLAGPFSIVVVFWTF